MALLSYLKDWRCTKKNRVVFFESIFHLVKAKSRALVECPFVNLNPFQSSSFDGILSNLLGDWAI